MLVLHCPFCGARNEDEFGYIGDAAPRLSLNRPLEPDAYAENLYLRDNPAGLIEEYWYHRYGCQAIFAIRRNTRTHEIAS
jgi:sarcosine oxidase subunit delta